MVALATAQQGQNTLKRRRISEFQQELDRSQHVRKAVEAPYRRATRSQHGGGSRVRTGNRVPGARQRDVALQHLNQRRGLRFRLRRPRALCRRAFAGHDPQICGRILRNEDADKRPARSIGGGHGSGLRGGRLESETDRAFVPSQGHRRQAATVAFGPDQVARDDGAIHTNPGDAYGGAPVPERLERNVAREFLLRIVAHYEECRRADPCNIIGDQLGIRINPDKIAGAEPLELVFPHMKAQKSPGQIHLWSIERPIISNEVEYFQVQFIFDELTVNILINGIGVRKYR